MIRRLAGEDKPYTDWLRQQGCHQCRRMPAGQVHHATGAGMAMRSHDHLAMPLCVYCHQAFHDGSGPFKWMEKAGRREWQEKGVTSWRSRFRALTNRTVLDEPLLEPDTKESTSPRRGARTTTYR